MEQIVALASHTLSPEQSRVRVVDQIDAEALTALMRDEVCAMVVHGFVSDVVCEAVQQYFRRIPTSPYTHEVYEDGELRHLYLGVDRIGLPFNSTLTRENQADAKDRYYREALPSIRRLRAATAPHISPIDRLRLELDEVWPLGAHIASFEGRPMFVGIVRIMHPATCAGSELQPHFDALPTSVCQLDSQFAANIFVAVPEDGGELEVWDVPPVSPGSVLPDAWRSIGSPPVTIKPAEGDLIVFNSRKPHAIRRFQGSERISVQTFVGYRDGAPLLLWN